MSVLTVSRSIDGNWPAKGSRREGGASDLGSALAALGFFA
jgi:hypothetical protein